MHFILLFISAQAWASGACEILLLQSDREALERLYRRPPTERTLERVAMNRALGMTWASAAVGRPPNEPDYAKLDQIFGQAPMSYRGRLRTDALNATFLNFDVPFWNRKLTSYYGVSADAHVFSIFLEPGEVLGYVGHDLDMLKGAHVRDALGYLRYYLRGTDVVVVEVQSDLYRHLGISGRDRYRHWAKHLLFAFERFVTEHLAPAERIVIAGPHYQRRRWPDFRKKNDPARDAKLADALYAHLPKRLGYREIMTDLAFETPSPPPVIDIGEDTRNENRREPIGRAFARNARTAEATPARREWARHYSSAASNRYRAARGDLDGFRPAAPAPLGRRWIWPNRRSAIVGFAPVPDDQLFFNDGAREIYRDLRATYPKWVGAIDARTFVSTGRAEPFEDVAESVRLGEALTATFEHHPWQERHASLQIEETYLTAKGVCRRSTSPDYEIGPNVIAFCKNGESSHHVWGGLLESSGIYEFNVHLRLWRLARRFGFEPAIARPLDVGYVDRVFDQGFLVDADQYQSRHLRESPERVVQARFLARSGRRVRAVTDAIHSDRFGRAVGALLREAYAAADERLNEVQVPDHLNTVEDHAAALRYLARVAAANQPAAARVLARWARESLITIGILHGMRGHWGGTGPGGVLGARSGGATQARNMSLAGELRDLDENIYMPGGFGPVRDPNGYLDPDHQHEMAEQDLRHWQESYYWMSILLAGRNDAPEGVQLPQWVLGNPDKVNLPITIPLKATAEGLVHHDFLDREHSWSNQRQDGDAKEWPNFRDPAFAEAYSRGFKAFSNHVLAAMTKTVRENAAAFEMK